MNWTFEPKPNKWHVCPAKTQISLGIRPVWSESSLSPWRKLGSLCTHWVHSKDSDQTGRMPRLIWVFAGHTGHFVGFLMKCLIYVYFEWHVHLGRIRYPLSLCKSSPLFSTTEYSKAVVVCGSFLCHWPSAAGQSTPSFVSNFVEYYVLLVHSCIITNLFIFWRWLILLWFVTMFICLSAFMLVHDNFLGLFKVSLVATLLGKTQRRLRSMGS